MIESGGYKRFDKLIVVHCQTPVQLERLMKRDNISHEEAERRIKKKKHGDYLIDTSGGFESARQQTTEVWHELVAQT
jgi:dephospho-CoA kinase